MPTLTLNCPVYHSYRVHQIAGMFDVPLSQKLQTQIRYEMPPVDDPNWKIGCIVGPSGSGKSTIAKEIFNNVPSSLEGGLNNVPSPLGGRARVGAIPLTRSAPTLTLPQMGEGTLLSPAPSGEETLTGEGTLNWLPNQAVIDGFGDCNIKDIVNVLTLVGFSSPPSWLKPYSVLSNGEQFRCNLARALLRGTNNLVVFDEYTSVVDRNVAKIASAAIAKAIKTGKLNCRFVAVTCHYDILDWLEPDWVLDTATGKCQKVFLRRPNIELELFRCERSLWKQFKTHHYLSGTLSTSCRCYAALWQGKPVAFCALIPQQGFERWYRVSRIVTLPDYQGIGIGSRFLDSLAELYVGQHYRFSITASHPSIISHCKRSEHWKAINVQKTGSQHSRGRGVVSFEFS